MISNIRSNHPLYNETSVGNVSILHYNERDPDTVIDAVGEQFEKGLPVVLPTETLYGIGAPISNKEAMLRIFEIKTRPISQTLPISVGNLSMIDTIAMVHRWQRNSLKDNLPGPVTFILEARGLQDPLIVREGTIAIRVPRHSLFLSLCSRFGPIALTSANIHGGQEYLTGEQIDGQFDDELLVIEDDGSIGGKGSSIVDLTTEIPTILREGKINKDDVMGEKHGRG